MRIAILAIVALLVAQSPGARADSFGTSGIDFSQPTTIDFAFDASSLSNVPIEVGVYDLTGVTPDVIPTKLSYEAPLVATLFDFPGGVTTLGATASFTFEPGHDYALGIHFPSGYRGADWVYSTTALNGFFEPYSARLGDQPTNQFAVFLPGPVPSVDALHFYQHTSVDFLDTGSAVVAFGAEGDGQNAFVVLDVSVPEPASAAVALLATGLIARRARRR
jgi:hypothetical protein